MKSKQFWGLAWLLLVPVWAIAADGAPDKQCRQLEWDAQHGHYHCIDSAPVYAVPRNSAQATVIVNGGYWGYGDSHWGFFPHAGFYLGLGKV